MLEPETLRPSIALVAYAEPLLEGRRVIVFGDSSSGLAQELLERGARLVHVYDPDASRVAENVARNTSRDVSIAALAEGGLALRDGAFDVGLIDDLTRTGPAHSVLKRLRRALSPRGVALVAAPNPDTRSRLVQASPLLSNELDYYQLYDAVAAEFAVVRMLGQTPFVGYAVVDFAAGRAPEPSLDTTFVPGGAEEPEWFVALGSSAPIRLDEYAVIELPLSAVRMAGVGDSELRRELERTRSAEQRARERLGALESQVNELNAALRSHRVKHPDAEVVARLEQELAKRDKWIVELEARAAVADARADEAETLLEEARESTAPQPEVEAEARALRAEAESLRARVMEQAERIAALTTPVEVSGEDDIGRLEAQLSAQGAELRRAENRTAEAERVGRELLDELERLAELNAEREADLEAARWAVQQLDGSGAPNAAELERARAELQRQSVLLEQARHGERGLSG